MPLEIITFPLGPMDNNTYLAADSSTRQAVVIDPSFDPQPLLQALQARKWSLTGIWLTHAHFDHIAGVRPLYSAAQPKPAVTLHPADLPLWQDGGGARRFGLDLEANPEPSHWLQHGELIQVGEHPFEIRHTPGHTLGHVIFYSSAAGVVFCGDLIFYHSVGRTDLPGSNPRQLTESILTQVYTLPEQTRLLCGHGPETSVGEEKLHNPFVRP
jgi:hydroxyacylglutathione hydrolase